MYGMVNRTIEDLVILAMVKKVLEKLKLKAGLLKFTDCACKERL